MPWIEAWHSLVYEPRKPYGRAHHLSHASRIMTQPALGEALVAPGRLARSASGAGGLPDRRRVDCASGLAKLEPSHHVVGTSERQRSWPDTEARDRQPVRGQLRIVGNGPGGGGGRCTPGQRPPRGTLCRPGYKSTPGIDGGTVVEYRQRKPGSVKERAE